MTSDGSAVTRLQRALANPRTSASQIRAIASELPRVGLEDALAILLALLTLASLAALPGPGARAGAEALIVLSNRYGLTRVDDLLIAWLQARGTGK
jgi:hypothetical protein